MADIEIRVMTKADESVVREFVTGEFVKSAPLSKTFKIDGDFWFNLVFPPCVRDGISVVAIDKSNDKLVGMRLSAIVYQNSVDPLVVANGNAGLEIALKIFRNLYEGLDLFTKYNVDRLVNFRGLCVAKSYRKRGIATMMTEKSLALIRDINIRLVTVETTSRFSKGLFERFGFENLVENRYEDIVIDGMPLELSEDLIYHESCVLFVKTLE